MNRKEYDKKIRRVKSKDTNLTKVSFRMYDFVLKDMKEQISQSSVSFSKFIRACVIYVYVRKARGKLVYYLDSEDKKKLQNFLYYLSKMSTNLNQSTYALNSMKDYTFLDYRHDELMDKLNGINQSLKEIDDSLDSYQNEIARIFKNFR